MKPIAIFMFVFFGLSYLHLLTNPDSSELLELVVALYYISLVAALFFL